MIVTKKVYLIARSNDRYDFEDHVMKSEIEYIAWPHDRYPDGRCVGETEVSFEVPEELDPVQLKVQALEKEKEDLQAKFTARITEIQRQINECLAIEG